MVGTLIISNNNKLYQPVVLDDIQWSTERSGSAGKLTFKVVCDDNLKIEEGNQIAFRWNDSKIFLGYVFKISLDETGVLSIIAYDQLRYFKSKDTYVVTDQRADEVIRDIATVYAKINSSQLGTIETTKYTIPSLVEDGESLFDIIADCLDAELLNSGEMYVLYDDYGKLSLKNIASMKLNVLIDENTGQNYSFSSDIDENTYNQIVLTYDDENTGKRKYFMKRDEKTISKWGLLQYYDTLQDGENGSEKAETLLKLYNNKTRSFKVSNAIGDCRVRAGVMVPVLLDLKLCKIAKWMLVESCKHTFKNNEHWMDLQLRGGDIV